MPSPFSQRAQGGEQALDRDHVLFALGLLMEPSQTFELRTLPSGRSRICKGSDLPAAVNAAWELSDEKGLYFCLNPVRPDLVGAASNKDVLSRRWLLIDIDTQREDKDSNATEEEKRLASDVVSAVLVFLVDECGWPHPLVVDSGNGFHLLVRIEMDCDKVSKQLLKEFLARLGDRFDIKNVKIDRAVHNEARISKLPGSWARKGPHTEDRPHRLAKLLVDFPPAPVSFEQIKSAKDALSPQSQNKNGQPSPFTKRATDGNGLESYIKSATERECGKLMMETQNRNDQLNASAYSLGKYAAWPETNASLIKSFLKRAAIQCGLGESETDKTIESGWNSGAADPKPRPIEPINGHAKTLPPGTARIIWGSSIKRAKIEWLVPRRVPLGKMTTFAGQTGMGKTYTVCDLAARVTRGMEIPFSGGLCFEQGKVLIISAEDEADDTLLPRFLDMGGDDSKLAFLSPEAEENFSLAALELLNGCLDDMGQDVRLIAIDPPTSYLGKTDDHKNAELRGLLGPIKRFCKKRNVAMIFVTHVNKSAQSVDALQRVMGSVAWVAAVRAAHMFCQDPDDNDSRLYVPLKVNSAPKAKALRYTIEGPEDAGVLRWIEEVDMTADEAIGNVKRKSRGVCAMEWLTERFRENYQWESDSITRAAKEAGISRNALWAPEVNALPFTKKRRVNADGVACWMWTANQGWPPKNKETDGTVGTVNDKPL